MADNKPATTRLWPIGLSILVITLSLTACASQNNDRSEQQAADFVTQGRLLAAQGLTEEALRAFELAIEYNPNLAEAHLEIGKIHRERGHFKIAGKSYERAAKSNPNSFDAHYYLGLMRQMTGRLKQAISSYLRAITIQPDNFEAHQHLASTYLQLQMPNDALPYALRATELNHENQSAWANLAATYSLLKQHHKAIDAYRESIELGEMANPILLGLANSHAQVGHYEQARVVLETLIKQDTSSTAYERMGMVMFKMRKFNLALQSYEQALKINPSDTSALNGKGVCLMTRYLQSGRTDQQSADKALGAWRQSLKIRPSQPRIVSLLTRYQHL